VVVLTLPPLGRDPQDHRRHRWTTAAQGMPPGTL